MAVQPVPLPKRAVHIHFLRRLCVERVPGESKTYGELTTAEVVKLFIRPATAQAKSSYQQALLSGLVLPKHQLAWCTSGTIRDTDGIVQQAFGQARFFASHAWSYKFGALVSMLENHYAQLPGTKGGGRFVPVYYWVDIFAVTQHFTGDFKDHPDSDFAGVIRSSKAVLFTMHPWRSPIAPTRVWCLFEALTAIQASGVDFEVVVDVKDSKDTRVQTVTVISGSIDVRTAQATVSSDKTYILGCIEQGIGVNAFNNAIRKRLKEALLQAVTPNAVEMGDTAALHELLKVGGCVRPDGIADLASCFRFASEADMLNIMRTIQLRDLRPRGLVLSGKQRTKEVTLSDGGLRGWDGESFSLREYGELDTGRMQWAYLPAGPALCQAVGDLLAMPTHSGAGATSSNLRGIEELWISLKPPRPDEFAKPNIAGMNGHSGVGSAPSSPKGPPGSGERTGAGSTLLGREASGTSSALPLLRDGIMRSSGSFTSSSPAVTAIRQELSRAGGSSFSGGNSRSDVSRSVGSFPGVPSGGGSPGNTLGGSASGTLGGGSGPVLRRNPSFSSPGNGLRPELSRAGGSSFSSSGALAPERSSGLQPQKLEPLPPGRPALWAAVSIGRTLRHLCVHQSVLAPPDVALLANALQNNKILEILQFVKCTAPGAESSGAHSTARLTGELLALGLSASNLRQLHVRPADPLYLDNLPPISTPLTRSFRRDPGSVFGPLSQVNSHMRRVSLTPVLLGPAAIRQLARALAQPPQLHSITVGLDPAPYTTFMPKELCDREHWLAHEDKNEPDMALKRRRIMGLDEDGQAAYADMKKYLGPLKELAAEALKAAPDTFTNKFDVSKKEQRAAKSRLQATAPTPEAHATRQNLILRVQQSIDKLGQPLKVSPFGSFVSGHYDAKSDLDLVLSGQVPSARRRRGQKQEDGALMPLHAAARAARTRALHQVVAQLLADGVTSSAGVEDITKVDLVAGSAREDLKAWLVAQAAELQPAFSPLFRLVKLWAKANGINDAASHTFNSWCITLLVRPSRKSYSTYSDTCCHRCCRRCSSFCMMHRRLPEHRGCCRATRSCQMRPLGISPFYGDIRPCRPYDLNRMLLFVEDPFNSADNVARTLHRHKRRQGTTLDYITQLFERTARLLQADTGASTSTSSGPGGEPIPPSEPAAPNAADTGRVASHASASTSSSTGGGGGNAAGAAAGQAQPQPPSLASTLVFLFGPQLVNKLPDLSRRLLGPQLHAWAEEELEAGRRPVWEVHGELLRRLGADMSDFDTFADFKKRNRIKVINDDKYMTEEERTAAEDERVQRLAVKELSSRRVAAAWAALPKCVPQLLAAARAALDAVPHLTFEDLAAVEAAEAALRAVRELQAVRAMTAAGFSGADGSAAQELADRSRVMALLTAAAAQELRARQGVLCSAQRSKLHRARGALPASNAAALADGPSQAGALESAAAASAEAAAVDAAAAANAGSAAASKQGTAKQSEPAKAGTAKQSAAGEEERQAARRQASGAGEGGRERPGKQHKGKGHSGRYCRASRGEGLTTTA
eukprot:XP_001695432.1 predicted protein [Chlamydomonas reinhardtii]